MSFISSLKRMFGIEPDQEYSDTDINDVAESAENETVSPQSEANDSVTDTQKPEIDLEMRTRIFEGVISIFNSALPDFLARSVDPEAQKRVLFQALDESISKYLDGLNERAEQCAEAKLKNAIDTSKREAERLRNEVQQIDQQRSSIREQQLSADRRRRALADRVTDLEQQLAAAEAEREQLQLENKSMLNKLKVADIQPGVVDEMSQEIERLKAMLAEKNSTSPEGNDSELVAELDTLKSQNSKLAEELAAANEQNAKLQGEITTLKSAVENLKEQAGMGQIMYNDMQEKYAAERDKRQACEEELAEAKLLIDQVAVLQEQFAKVEKLIQKRDERIEKLKSMNKHLKEELAAAKQAIESFNSPNLFACEPEEEPVVETPYDDDFECPDWFVSEPDAAHGPLRPANDSSFGYTEPPKKPKAPESDAQLSLF